MSTLEREKIDFCARYLANHGVNSEDYDRLVASLSEKPTAHFEIVKQTGHTFFVDVATGLRDMWPAGNKDGKWPWRESVNVLVERLKFIWNWAKIDEGLYSVEDCLEAGRRYTARFENESVKYMQVLKYFIFKQKDVGVDEKGIIKKTYESTLINLLQNKEPVLEFDSDTEFI